MFSLNKELHLPDLHLSVFSLWGNESKVFLKGGDDAFWFVTLVVTNYTNTDIDIWATW